jgi:hypothetical protein
VDAPLAAPDSLVRPWRRATIVASLIAAVELVALLLAGVALIGKPLAHAVRRQAEVRAFAPAKKDVPALARQVLPTIPKLARSQTDVLVLNGNGRNGAASEAAARIRGAGYLIAGTGNAPRHDYASTVVMFRPGFHAEALRLARDLRVRVVGPLDGMKTSQLMGAHLVVVLGVG